MAKAVTTEAALPVVTENSAASWGSSVSVARKLAALANAASDSRDTARVVMGNAIIPENAGVRLLINVSQRQFSAPPKHVSPQSGARHVCGLHKQVRPNILDAW